MSKESNDPAALQLVLALTLCGEYFTVGDWAEVRQTYKKPTWAEISRYFNFEKGEREPARWYLNKQGKAFISGQHKNMVSK